MGSSARDVVQGLGDALAGVNRNNEFLKGEQIGADVNEKRAQTEAAMGLARQRRIEAEVTEAKKQRQDQIAAQTAAQLADPDNAPLGAIIAAGAGSDYAGAMSGRNSAQQYRERATVATPAPLGDTVAEANRQAALEALAPASALQSQRPRSPGAPVVVKDEDGNDVFVAPADAPGKRPGSKPAAQPGPTTHMRDIEYLTAHGWSANDAQQMVMGPKANPEALYNAVLNAELRNFKSPEDAAATAKAMVATRFGADAAEGASQPRGPDPEAAGLPRGVPKGSKLIGHTKDGGEVYELPDGSKVVAE